MKEPRHIVAEIIVDDAKAEKMNTGTIDYLYYLIDKLGGKIELVNARIIDSDDEEDKEFIEAVNKIF